MTATKDPEGRLAENILYFARALRAAGIPLGPGSVLDALAAVRAAGVGGKEDFYWTLHAVFVKRHEHSVLFDQAFRIFFRKRGYLERLIAMMSPEMTGAPAQAEQPQASQRVLDALFSGRREDRAREAGDRARRALHRVRPRGAGEEGLRADDRGRDRGRPRTRSSAWCWASTTSRRAGSTPHPHGHRIDLRRTLRASMKAGGALIDLKYRGPKTKTPPIVALLDISGSMSQYTRLFLHFLHAVTDARKRVYDLPVRHAADQRVARAEGEGSRTRRWRPVRRACSTGRAARGSPPRCGRSTSSGRAGC